MNITLVIGTMQAGGAEKVLSLLANHWVKKKFNITLLTFDHSTAKSYYRLNRSINLINLDLMGNTKSPIAMYKLRKALIKSQPDVVLSFLADTNVRVLFAATGLPFPIIVCDRSNPQRENISPLTKGLRNLFYPFADKVIVQTQEAKALYANHLQDAINVIPNPVENYSKYRKKSETKKIVTAGRLHVSKAYDVLIPAFAKVTAKHPDWQLLIWGKGPEFDALQKISNDHGMQEAIVFKGLSPKPGEWMKTGDIFVLSSRWEGFPNVLAEAMLAGMPVISTDCACGPKEMITDGKNGLLTRCEDEQSLADAMIHLIEDKGLQRKIATATQPSMKKYEQRNVLDKWTALVESMAK